MASGHLVVASWQRPGVGSDCQRVPLALALYQNMMSDECAAEQEVNIMFTQGY
jgi:hypothetical protein